MKIEGTEYASRQVTVEVNDEDALKGIFRDMLKAHGIVGFWGYHDHGPLIKKGAIYREDEVSAGSHSWFDEQIVIEKPTKKQLDVVVACSEFYQLWRDARDLKTT